MALSAMMASGVRKMMNVMLETVEALPGIVLGQGISVIMGCVMIIQINELPSPIPMVPPVMTGCGVPFPTNVQVESVGERRGIVLQQGISVILGYAMRTWISALPSPGPMVPPVMTDCSVPSMINV